MNMLHRAGYRITCVLVCFDHDRPTVCRHLSLFHHYAALTTTFTTRQGYIGDALAFAQNAIWLIICAR
jgi:hypothetical protein